MDFIQICEKYRIPYRTHGAHTSRGWIQTDCYNCGPGSNKFHLGYNVAIGRFSCWRCGGKHLESTLQALTGASLAVVREIVAELPRQKNLQQGIEASGVLKLPDGIGPLQDCHKQYLRDRGYSWLRLQELWHIQGIGLEGGRLQWRIFIPFEYNDRVVSWTTRSIAKSEDIVRYLTASKSEEMIDHKKLLYGHDYARNSVVVVEGLFDVWAIGPGALGTLGTRVSKAQIKQLAKYPKRYICYDHGAERYMQRLAEELSLLPGKTFTIELEAKDPDSADTSELKSLRKLLK
jgi:hypothetical protein